MTIATTLRALTFDQALSAADDGAAFVDLRSLDDYLDVHIPGSLLLFYEFGPGMAARARDCLPLDLPLILLDLAYGDMTHAAASLRGKGFTVLGALEDGINEWAARKGTLASTDVVRAPIPPRGTVLDVGDPGAPSNDDAVRIPAEQLWPRIGEVTDARPVIVAAGAGVRAGLAVGIIERAGIDEIVFWRGA